MEEERSIPMHAFTKRAMITLIMLPAIICALVGAVFLGTVGTMHAASTQMRHTVAVQPADARDGAVLSEPWSCPYGSAEFDASFHIDILHRPTWALVCPNTPGGSYGPFNDVFQFNTGFHQLAFTWQDWNLDWHYSSAPPRTIINAGDVSPNEFAGFGSMRSVIILLDN